MKEKIKEWEHDIQDLIIQRNKINAQKNIISYKIKKLRNYIIIYKKRI